MEASGEATSACWLVWIPSSITSVVMQYRPTIEHLQVCLPWIWSGSQSAPRADVTGQISYRTSFSESGGNARSSCSGRLLPPCLIGARMIYICITAISIQITCRQQSRHHRPDLPSFPVPPHHTLMRPSVISPRRIAIGKPLQERISPEASLAHVSSVPAVKHSHERTPPMQLHSNVIDCAERLEGHGGCHNQLANCWIGGATLDLKGIMLYKHS